MASNNTYSSKLIESSRPLDVKERLKMKDTTDAIKLDKATEVSDVLITPDMWAVISVHNEKSDNKDYNNYIILDQSGTKYSTGSNSFWNAFTELKDELESDGESILGTKIKVYRHQSKNYSDKYFLTCSIA